jgi:hypothetical protein
MNKIKIKETKNIRNLFLFTVKTEISFDIDLYPEHPVYLDH